MPEQRPCRSDRLFINENYVLDCSIMCIGSVYCTRDDALNNADIYLTLFLSFKCNNFKSRDIENVCTRDSDSGRIMGIMHYSFHSDLSIHLEFKFV